MTNLKNEVEALLFSSGRRMTVEELAKLCRTRNYEKIQEALEELKKDYSSEEKSLMLIQEDQSYKLTVREKYMPVVQKIVTQTELRKSVIETLATIAYKAPIKQSEIVKIRSNKAYDHLNELEENGFITREKQGRTKLIKLGEKFFEYFDLPPEKLKEKFMTFQQVEKVIEQKEDEIEKAKEMLEKEKKATELLGPDGKPQELDTYGKQSEADESKVPLKEFTPPILVVDEPQEVVDEIEKAPLDKHPGLRPQKEVLPQKAKKAGKKDILEQMPAEEEPEEETGEGSKETEGGEEEPSMEPGEPEEEPEPSEEESPRQRMPDEEEESPKYSMQEDLESNAEEKPLEIPKSRKKSLADISSEMEEALDKTEEPELPESGIDSGEEDAGEEPSEKPESEEPDEEFEEDATSKKDKSIKEDEE